MNKLFYLFLVILVFPVQCSTDPGQVICTPFGIEQRFKESMKMPWPGDTILATPDNFTFIHITDLHTYKKSQTILSSLGNYLLLKDAFIIASGDLTENGAREDFITTKNLLGALSRPVYYALGNHDLWYGGWRYYKEVLGPSVYTARTGNVLVVVLDSANGVIGSKQLKWLEDTLAGKTESSAIVVLHHNIFSPRTIEPGQENNIEEVYSMMRLFEKYGVGLVLMGHSHIYDFHNVNGVQYLVGADMKTAASNSPNGFNRVTYNNGIYSHQFIVIP